MKTCQTIMIQSGGGDTFACGQPTVAGSNYCAKHIQIRSTR